MKYSTSGFTLIELMIVVSIIGILASIAIPSYQSFIARSQVSESITMLDTARVMVEDYTSIGGSFPANKAALISLDINIQGTYGSITGVSDVSNDAGSIIYKLSPTGVQNSVKNKSVWLSRASVNGGWSCTSNLLAKFSPKDCDYLSTAPSGL